MGRINVPLAGVPCYAILLRIETVVSFDQGSEQNLHTTQIPGLTPHRAARSRGRSKVRFGSRTAS